MVYMSGGRMSRNSASIINRTNVCGGPKKAGTGPRVGSIYSNNPWVYNRAPQTIPMFCIPNHTTQTQSYGYRATHGGNMG
jgi:hypothetical protein